MQRLLILLVLMAGVDEPAQAGSLEDWLSWRILEDAREVEEQIGLDLGDRMPLDLYLLRDPRGGRVGRDLMLVNRRVAVPPRIRVGLTVSDARDSCVAVAVTLFWSGFRRKLVAVPRRLPDAIPDLDLPPRPSGVPALDRVLWSLALAERDALASISRPGRPLGHRSRR